MNREIERISELANKATQSYADANKLAFETIKAMLKPFGETPISLYDHEGIGFCAMAELKPYTFHRIEEIRVRDNRIEMLVCDEWHELGYTDYHFLLDEILNEVVRLLTEREEIAMSVYWDFYHEVWESMGSFNELLGCAKHGHKDMLLTRDVDEYNNNFIACEVKYDNLVVEFTYDKEHAKGFYPSNAWYKGVEVGFDLTDIMKK